ncbi:MAG: ATP-binding cassette domain-containing protein [Acidimicrobiales bacterium]
MTGVPVGLTVGDTGSLSGPRLECRGVTVRFGGLVALDDVDVVVPAMTIVGLVGPNGAGKSTLFNVLSGLSHPSAGRVLLNGEDVTHARPRLRAGLGVARTFQQPELFVGLTVREHLVLAYRVRHARARIWSDIFTMGSLRPVKEDEQTNVESLLELLGLGAMADRSALGLPLGWARLVELGRALATSPTVLLLDEPSAGMDSSETEQFESSLLSVARERGISVLLVEHDVELVMRMCSTVYVLDFGILIASGSPDEVLTNPKVRAAYLGEELSPGEGAKGDGGTMSVSSSALPALSPHAQSSEPEGRSPALAVENLSVSYGKAVALSGVSFSVGTGEALVVLGANGAGKSSLARALCGLVRPSGGRVVFDGQEIGSWAAHRIRRSGLVYLPEGRGVFPDLTVIENLRMAAAVLGGRQARRDGVARALEIFPKLADRRRHLACLLSGGERQMLSLARAFVTSPKLVIADEMSLGLAPQIVDLVFDSLARVREAGVTVIMIEQYVHRALTFGDECIVLQRGTLAWAGPAAAADGQLLRHYLGDVITG